MYGYLPSNIIQIVSCGLACITSKFPSLSISSPGRVPRVGGRVSGRVTIPISMALPNGTSPVNRALDVSSQAATHSMKPPVRLQQGCGTGTGRRALLSLLLSTAVIPEDSESKKSLLEGYLKRSKENKAKNDKERLDDYYKRNYKDYFELIEGSADGKKEDQLTESEKAIRDWLQKNR